MSKKSKIWLASGLALLLVAAAIIWNFSANVGNNAVDFQPPLINNSGNPDTDDNEEPDPIIPFDSPLVLAEDNLPLEQLKEYEEVYIFEKGNLYGLVSASGSLIMEPQYDYLEILYDYAADKQRLILARRNRKITESALFAPDGRQLTDFAVVTYEYNSGFYAVARTDQGSRLIGIDSGQDWILPASGDFGFTLNELNYFDKDENKLYFLNEDLSSKKFLRDVEWFYALDKEKSGYTVVINEQTKRHGLADKDGNLVIPCLYDSLGPGGSNLVLASDFNASDLVLTLNNQEVFRYQGNIHYALPDLAVVSKRDNPQAIFLVDKKGKKISDTFVSLWNLGEYFPGSPFSEFYLAQKQIDDWGLENEPAPSQNQPDPGGNPEEGDYDEDYYNSMFGIEPDNTITEPKEDDSLWLQMIGGQSYENQIIDATGKTVYKFKSNPLNWLSAFPGDRLLIERRDRKSNDIQLSFLRYDGKELLGPSTGYISITPIQNQKQHFSGYYAAAKQNSDSAWSYNVIDTEGKAIIRGLDSVYSCGKDRVVGVKNGKPCLLDIEGMVLFTY